MDNESMRILSLKAENVKRLHIVEMDFDGGLKIIGGRNEQGKSSTLDALAWAIGGKKLLGVSPIRDGSNKMSTEVVLKGDSRKLIITRTMTQKSDTIKIVENGKTLHSPQALLDALTNSLTFDPLEFSKFDAKKQGEVFMDLVGLDFTEIDKGIKFSFDERTIAKRLLGQIESTLEPMQEKSDRVDVAELSKALGAAHENNAKKRDANNTSLDLLSQRESIEKRIAELKIESDEIELRRTQAAVVWADTPYIDTDPIQSQLDAAGEVNARYEHNAKMVEIETRIKKGNDVVSGHDKAIKDGRATKAKMLADAKVPIADLGIDDEGLVTYKEHAFSQCSSAERLRVSFSIAAAMNPKLKLVMIRDGAYLDSDNLKEVAKMASEYGMDVLMERVGDGDECSVIIEDGRILK